MARSRTPRLGSTSALESALLVLLIVLIIVGVLAVASASAPQAAADGGSTWSFIERDLLYVVIGLMAFVAMVRLPIKKVCGAANVLMVGSIGLLAIVEVMGSTVSGGQRWLGYGSLQFQPSELFKLAACVFLAATIARAEKQRQSWRQKLWRCSPVLIGTLIIAVEPDMGTAAIVGLLLLGVLIVAGLPGRTMRSVIAVGAAALAVFAVSSPYRRERLLSFLHPSVNGSGSGYQVLQAKIGLGAGRFKGLGYGQSREKWGLLPNPHTDFIFAIIGEELGFIGAVFVILLFVTLLYLCLRVALRAPDRQSQLIVAGVTFWLGFEALINIASVVGLLPVTGIPLPFISYGGTSLIIDLMAYGLVVNVARRIPARRTPPHVPTPPPRHDHAPRRSSTHSLPRTLVATPTRERVSRH